MFAIFATFSIQNLSGLENEVENKFISRNDFRRRDIVQK